MGSETLTVEAVMTPCPYKVESGTSLNDALQVMSFRGVNHLPVVENGELIGVLRESEVRVLGAVAASSKAPFTAGGVCDREPFVVMADTPLSEVAAEMATGRFSSALVVDAQGNFVGIFTTTDACRVISMLLRK